MEQKVYKKAYVRGSYLYSDSGNDYEEKNKLRQVEEKVIDEKIGVFNLKQQLIQQRNQVKLKKTSQKNDRPMLIEIRQTPVEPLPEPVVDIQKCQRATQEQFQYFQTYIIQKQKQAKFEINEQKKIDQFVKNQQILKLQQMNKQNDSINLIMEKQKKQKNKNKIVRIRIKKKIQGEQEGQCPLNKVRNVI